MTKAAPKGPKLTKTHRVGIVQHCLDTIHGRLDPTPNAKVILEAAFNAGYQIVFNHVDLRKSAAMLMDAGLLECEGDVDCSAIFGGSYGDRKVLLRNNAYELMVGRVLGMNNGKDVWFKPWSGITLDTKYPRGFYTRFFSHPDTAHLRDETRTQLIKACEFPTEVEQNLTELIDIVQGTVYIEELIEKLPELENLIREVTSCQPVTKALAIQPSKKLTNFLDSMAPIPEDKVEAGSFA